LLASWRYIKASFALSPPFDFLQHSTTIALITEMNMYRQQTAMNNTVMDGFPRDDITLAKHLKDMIICE
jgi:hypothetical protein